jgi:hypothetical protein
MANEPKCDGRHSKGDGSWWDRDARGIETARVCNDCIDMKRKRYRPEIFTDSQYESEDCPIEPDLW